MRKFIAIFMIGCLMIGLTGCFIQDPGEKYPTYVFMEEGSYDLIRWEGLTFKIEKGYLEKEERNLAAMQVESALSAAKTYLSGWKMNPVEVVLNAGDGATMVYENLVDVYYAQNRDIPYTSLILQAMAGVEGVTDWIREGTGAYVADINKESMLDTQGHMIECLTTYAETERKAESSNTEEELYFDIDTLAHVLYTNQAYLEALEFGDLAASIASIGYAQEAYNFRGAYCIYAGSFVHYLESRFGRETVLRIYHGEDFTDLTGTSLEGTKMLWTETLK